MVKQIVFHLYKEWLQSTCTFKNVIDQNNVEKIILHIFTIRIILD